MLTSQSHSVLPTPRLEAKHHEPVLSRCGEYWNVQFHGRTLLVRDSKGIEDLARVIDGPTTGLHVLSLFQEMRGVKAVPHGVGSAYEDGLSIRRSAATWDEPIDPRARAAYRTRYLQLTEALEEARERNDMGHVERCQDELASLLKQLGQRRYVTCTATERARKAVYNRVQTAIRRLGRLDRELGMHLQRTIKTGIYCSYRRDIVPCGLCAPRIAPEGSITSTSSSRS